MKRIGFKMKLHAGHAAEYRKRHDEIWPELSEVITRSGTRDYSIFHDPETDILFGVLYVPDDAGLGDPGSEPIVRKWWDFMSDIMDTNPDKSPVQKPLVEVFHMD
jgi:L-rhamnose mutarotase